MLRHSSSILRMSSGSLIGKLLSSLVRSDGVNWNSRRPSPPAWSAVLVESGHLVDLTRLLPLLLRPGPARLSSLSHKAHCTGAPHDESLARHNAKRVLTAVSY